MLMKGFLLMGAFLLALATSITWAQEVPENEKTLPDTTIIVTDTIELNDQGLISTTQQGAQEDTVIITSEQKEKKIPRTAALYSAVLPGLGQTYNESYWKIPIIYGAFISLGWLVTYQDDRYQVLRRANQAVNNRLEDQNPLRGLRVNITRGLESTRRDRDFTYILIAGAYALQIMEAIVDAHLIEFEVNEDLALEVQPSLGQYFAYASQSHFAAGIGIVLTLKIK